MDITTRLKTDHEFDPYLSFGRVPKDEILVALKELLALDSELKSLMTEALFRENLFKLINFVYLRALNDPSRSQKEKVSARVFDLQTTQRIRQLAEQL